MFVNASFKPICRLQADFSTKTCVLLHVYFKIIKFYLLNYYKLNGSVSYLWFTKVRGRRFESSSSMKLASLTSEDFCKRKNYTYYSNNFTSHLAQDGFFFLNYESNNLCFLRSSKVAIYYLIFTCKKRNIALPLAFLIHGLAHRSF